MIVGNTLVGAPGGLEDARRMSETKLESLKVRVGVGERAVFLLRGATRVLVGVAVAHTRATPRTVLVQVFRTIHRHVVSSCTPEVVEGTVEAHVAVTRCGDPPGLGGHYNTPGQILL